MFMIIIKNIEMKIWMKEYGVEASWTKMAPPHAYLYPSCWIYALEAI